MNDERRNEAPEEEKLHRVRPEQLEEILEQHARWLDSEGLQGERADLSRCDLKGASLGKANLQQARLDDADLQQANLRAVNLQQANLAGTNLQQANLFGANLQHAHFGKANLQQAVLQEANLRHAYLGEANLQQASLGKANLEHATLDGTNLTNARMHEVVIDDATVFESLFFGPDHDPFNDGHGQIKIPDRDRRLDWSGIRFIGELPLFGVSWASLALSLAYVNTASLLNGSDWVELIGHELPIPERMGLILISSLLLAVGSTLFKLLCPPRVQEFPETLFVETHNRPRLLYYIESWRRRKWQLPTLLLTAAGILLGLGLVLERLWWAATYLWNASGAS